MFKSTVVAIALCLGLAGCSLSPLMGPTTADTWYAPTLPAAMHTAQSFVVDIRLTPVATSTDQIETRFGQVMSNHAESYARLLGVRLAPCRLLCEQGALALVFEETPRSGLLHHVRYGHTLSGEMRLEHRGRVLARARVHGASDYAELAVMASDLVRGSLVHTAQYQLVKAYESGQISDRQLAYEVAQTNLAFAPSTDGLSHLRGEL